MRVFVKNMRGQGLMPCSQRKARLLLKQKKAKIVGYKPFTIQLCYATGEAKQEIIIGVDEGARHVGIAVVSQNKVLAKGEVELRQDVHSLLLTRAQYRRSRRFRKTRYRKARFLNRRKPKGWLPPSIRAKLEVNFVWIDKFCSLVPNPKLRIEVGKFDIAKMINPDIQGVDYQYGQTYGYYDVRYFVFARDEYTCQVCKKKDKVLQTHHIVYKSEGGTDKVDNLITVCTDCHTSVAHKPGGVLYSWMKEHKKVRRYKEPAFMNALRLRTFSRYPEAEITYGSETSPKRKGLGLEKTHYNDAIAIAVTRFIKENPKEWFSIRQFRKKKRSLHEATPRKGRKHPNTTQKRNSKNTKERRGRYLNDEVMCFGKRGWISGFSGVYSAYILDSDGQNIHMPGKNYRRVNLSDVVRICHNNTWQYFIHKEGL